MKHIPFEDITGNDLLRYSEDKSILYPVEFLDTYKFFNCKDFRIKTCANELYPETQEVYDSDEFRDWFSEMVDSTKHKIQLKFTPDNQIYAWRGIKTKADYVDDLNKIPEKIGIFWTTRKSSAKSYDYASFDGTKPMNIVFGAYLDIDNIDWNLTLLHRLHVLFNSEYEINPIEDSAIHLDYIGVNGNPIDITPIKRKQFYA